MSDKKNFSVFNKLDEKYVEEADAYSASPKVEKKRRKDERAARKAKIKSRPSAQHFHKRSRRVAKRIAQIAACFLILFVGIRFGGVGLFKSRHEAPSDGANESSCPESAKDSAEGGGDDDSPGRRRLGVRFCFRKFGRSGGGAIPVFRSGQRKRVGQRS